MKKPSHVGAVLSKEPVVDEPSPLQVDVVGDPSTAKPKPVLHVKVHTLPKLLLSVQDGAFPLAEAERSGQVIAAFKD